MPPSFKPIDTLEDLASAIAASYERPTVIFKHSASCGLSAQAFHSIGELLDQKPPDANWFLLSVRNRPVSAAVTAQYGIRHESPQALLLIDGKVAWHGSHFRATAASITAALDRLAGATSARG